MNLGKGEQIYQFKSLTDLWTGSVTLEEKDGQIKEKIGPNRLVTTGLLGSIRWWFEVFVRGLGGYACDPTDTKCEGLNHCIVCEFFGCTGWARKFRFEVLGEDGKIKMDQIKQNQIFSLRFTPLRPICDEEWNLLDAILRLIAEYGAIGAKTVFKPTEEENRLKEIHHQDFGLIKILDVDPPVTRTDVTRLLKYLFGDRWKKPTPEGKSADFAWASLKHFWFVDGKTLSRENSYESTFNKVLGRKPSKRCRDCGKVHNPPQKCPKTRKYPKRYSEYLENRYDKISKWLAGSQQESKKVFSFKNPARTFGFVKPGLIDFDAMEERLKDVWGKDGWEFLAGEKIIDQLFVKEENRS